MRVLLSSATGHGHVLPMVPLAQAFLAAGHDVLWATSSSGREILAPAGIPTERAGLDGRDLAEQVEVLRARAGQLPPPERAAFMFPAMFGAAFAPPMAADLLPIARSFQPDLLVHEQGELAGPLVGAVVGVPSLTHAFGGAVPPAFLAEAGERLGPLWAEHGLDLPPFAGCFSAPYLDICPPSVQPVPVDHVPVRRALRPVSWTGPREPAVDRGTPLVYVTLGTVAASLPVLRAALDALAPLPVHVLLTVGPHGDAQALGTPPANAVVERYVSQAQVLPTCAVVVSHGGSGTFLGALASGVPQLCLPQAADQFRNAAAGARAGAALVLAPHEVTGEAVAGAVEQLLREPSFRAGARSVQAEIAAMPSPAEVVAALS